ncbi:MAG TPA: hypothetical protein VMU30_03310, partial [Bacteroidota bacterium]|nr:hypothetical protein [Bacteroidota bacterium]
MNSGVTVTVDAAATCLSVTNNGILTFTTFGMTVAGPWINNGTVNVGTATVTFNSATAAINAGTGNANFYTIATATTATTLTINTPVTVAGSLTLNGTAVSNTITIAGSNSITVTGTTSIPRPTTSGVSTIAVGAGTLSTATLTLSGTTNGRNTVVTVSTGTVTVTGNFTGAGTINPGGSVFTFTGAGTLNVGGTGTNAIPQSTTAWTFTPSTGTVNFNGANQTVGANTFNNLTFSGSGAKTIPTGTTTVNGIFSIENGANANTFTGTLAYGANATLQYNTSSARAVSTEWIT